MSRLILALVLCLPLFGCLKPPPPPGITRLQFYFVGWPLDGDHQRKLIAAFERENPDIKVDLTVIEPNYPEKIQTLLVGGIVPDVMSLDNSSYYEWVNRGMLVDVSDIMEEAQREQKMTFMPIVREQLFYNGGYYAVPTMMCGTILQLNLDMFRRAGISVPPPEGITWDWVAQVAPGLSRRSGNPKAPAEFFCTMPDMTSMLFSFGAKIFDDDRHPQQVLVNSPRAMEMCRFLRRLIATRAVISRAESTNHANLEIQNMYIRGSAVASIQGLWSRPGVNGTPVRFAWDVVPFPAGPHGDRVTANGSFELGISPRSQHIAAARRFLRFCLTPEAIGILDESGAAMPVFREMLSWPAFRPPNDPTHRNYYFDTMEAGACRYPVYGPGVGELRRIVDSRLDQVSSEPDVPIPLILTTLEGEVSRWLAHEKELGFYK